MSRARRHQNVTIAGTGAMACLFGARLASHARVTLTGSWSEAVKVISTDGIRVEEEGRQSTFAVNAVPWGSAIEPADLVIVLVKAWQTGETARRLPLLLLPSGAVLTLQNGLGNLEALGPRACLGVTYQGAHLLGPGRVQPGGEGPTWIAGPGWVVELFRQAGIRAEAAQAGQVDSLLWGKLAVNCGINALTALLGVRNGALCERPDAKLLMEKAAAECQAVAAGKGIALPFSDAAVRACEVARLTASNRSSMLQDVLRGAPTECDAIYGEVVRWGRRLGVPTPVNEVLYSLVRAGAAKAPAAAGEGGPVPCNP